MRVGWRSVEKYKQFMAEIKRAVSSVALDTITTRFMLLFLFLLTIPLVTVIIFTVSLLVNHMDETATGQLLLSHRLFEGAVSSTAEQLELWEDSGQACTEMSRVRCLKVEAVGGDTTVWGSRSWQYEVQHNRLYLVNVQPDAVFGLPIDDAFFRRIYHQQPQLQTEIRILTEPLQAQTPRWISHSPQSSASVPEALLLKRIQDLPTGQPINLELNQTTYKVFQEFIYGRQHEKIGRIIHILPLARQELLLHNYYLGIYIIAVASLIFSVLLAMLAGRTITQPMLRLIRQVDTLSRENVMTHKDEASIAGVYEIRQLAGAFNRMIQRLRQEHRMKDEFVATLTHDLKVPMLAEKQTLSYFRDGVYGPLAPEQAEVLDILQSSNRSCLALVNGLLEVYRYDAGEVSLVFEMFNLVKLMQETIGELQTLAQEKSVDLAIGTRLSVDGEEALVYADRLEIKRVLHNLVSNAISNTPSHGRIVCDITDTRTLGMDTVYKVSDFQYTTLKYPVNLTDRLLVSVQDSGLGFPHEDLPYLFQQFAATKSRNPMSIGLGLYNCHQVVRAHSGALWVETTEGEGSVVSFILPRNQQAARERRIFRDRRKSL